MENSTKAYYPHSLRRIAFSFLLAMLMLSGIPCFAAQDTVYASVKDIPDPKNGANGYISDPQGLLSPEERDSVNAILTDLDKKSGVEAAVVIINDFNADQDDFTFATDLFRQWGIGKRGANNGLLLFIATNRRKYRFITGYGVEGLLPDATLATIGERTLVPAFKEQAYGQGIIKSMQVLSKYLQQPANKKELDSLLNQQTEQPAKFGKRYLILLLLVLVAIGAAWQVRAYKSRFAIKRKAVSNIYSALSEWSSMGLVGLSTIIVLVSLFTGHFLDVLSFLFRSFPLLVVVIIPIYLFFAHLGVLSRLKQHFRDEVNYRNAVNKFYLQSFWQVLLSPFILLILLMQIVPAIRLRKRISPLLNTEGDPMQRIDRDGAYDVDKYLSAGQQKEEAVGSLGYDIWISDKDNEVKLVPNHGYQYSDFDPCPKCGFRTYTKPVKVTIDTATYTHAGKAKRVRVCRNCKHEDLIEFVTLSKLVRSSSSSGSSGSGSSSSSSSSSSSGSWGGGSTGGGGAGGRW